MSGTTAASTTASFLCDKCSVLHQIDDKALGFREDKDEERDFGSFLSHGPGQHDYAYEYQLHYHHDDLLPGLPGLEKSANSGCAFCMALHEAMVMLKINMTGRAVFSMRYSWGKSRSSGLTELIVNVEASGHDNGAKTKDKLLGKWSLRFPVDCEIGRCNEWLRARPSPREQVLCDENVSWLKRSLENCSTSCCPTPESGFLPTRLIDLGTGQEDDCIRLVYTSELNMKPMPHYAALSYCWGHKKEAACQLTTTSHSLEQHLDCIPLSKMTRVIQDTIQTTRALSIRYVWIDALCIVQDSIDDWARESVLMGFVYSNAFVTICPTSTSSCLEGFLNRALPVRVKFYSTLRPDVHGVFNLRYQHVHDTVNSKDLEILHPRLIDFRTPWHSRGWTFQEAQLSTRFLYFAHSCIYYSCLNHESTEAGELEGDFRQELPRALKKYSLSRDAEDLRLSWKELVLIYAQRQLTHELDRLPAISGLAKIISEAIGDEYLAGLWKDDLARGLLWGNKKQKEIYFFEDIRGRTKDELVVARSLSATHPYIGPSWSWIHFSHLNYQDLFIGELIPEMFDSSSSSFYEFDFREECNFYETSCTPASSLNPFGRLVDAKLVVRGRKSNPRKIWTEDLSLPFRRRWKVSYGVQSAVCDVDWWVPEGTRGIEVQNAFLLLVGSSYGQNVFYERDDLDYVFPGSEAYELHRKEKVRKCEIPSHRNAWGLIIQPIDDTRYIRLGRFRSGEAQGGMEAWVHLPVEEIVLV